jgi:plastocyanin
MFRIRLDLAVLAGVALALLLTSCKDKETNPPPLKELDSPALLGHVNGSANYIHTFATDGHYPYHCEFHTTANHREGGAVYVNPGGEDSAFVRIFLGAFDPPSVVVRAGGKVRWQNFDDGTHHDVTSD